MTAADLRGIFSLPDEAAPRPQKKQKKAEPRPENVSRELHGLWGDRAPPIAITDHISQFRAREKPKWGKNRKTNHWDITPFENQARSDGLMLKHWTRRKETSASAVAPATPTNSHEASKTEVDNDQRRQEPDKYGFAVFDIKVSIPTYSDAGYDEHLISDEWTREETDYLFSIARDFDLRWILIADRYDYQPSATESLPLPKERTMEDLKARYYQVCSKIQLLRTPLASMSTSEFATYEKTTKYDARMETLRKKLAQTLISRTPAEVQEEENLLIELKRIATNQEKFAQERAELHARLEYPQPQSGTQGYQSSQELLHLMQTLAAADRNRKRRSLLGQVDSSMSGNTGGSTPNGTSQSAEHGRGARTSMSGPLSSTSSTRPSFPPNHPGLSAREYAKFGVSKHDRLTAGVAFRNDRITKLMVPKPNAQTIKIKDALRELGIALRLTMPTTRTLAEFDKILEGVTKILDIRKVREKVENEVKVIRAEKRLDQGLEDEAEPNVNGVNGFAKVETGEHGAHDAGLAVNGTQDEQKGEDEVNAQEDEMRFEDEAEQQEGGQGEQKDVAQDGDEDAQAESDHENPSEAVDAEAEQADEAEFPSALQKLNREENEEQADNSDVDMDAAEEEDEAGEVDQDQNGDDAPGDTTQDPDIEDPDMVSKEESSSDEAVSSPAPTSRPSTGRGSVRNKRSASVMSAVSKGSSKRVRK